MTLYVARVYNFACNACDEVSADIIVATKAGARSAWPTAAADGWARRTPNVHFCPRHNPNRVPAVDDCGRGCC